MYEYDLLNNAKCIKNKRKIDESCMSESCYQASWKMDTCEIKLSILSSQIHISQISNSHHSRPYNLISLQVTSSPVG